MKTDTTLHPTTWQIDIEILHWKLFSNGGSQKKN